MMARFITVLIIAECSLSQGIITNNVLNRHTTQRRASVALRGIKS